MRRLLLLLVAVVGLLAAGCGGSHARSETSDYIDRVNAVMARIGAPLQQVSDANRAFAKSPGAAKIVPKLVRSQATLRRLRRQLREVDPPPEARKLHALLLRLVGREEELSGEVLALARFLPRFQAALAPVAPASRALGAELARKKGSPADKAAALDAYGTALAGAEQRLRRLKPPPVSQPVWRQERAMLAAVRTSGAALADGLRRKQAKRLPALLHAFDAASARNRTQAAQRVQIAAVKAYNRRIGELQKLVLAAGREERRLQGTLG
ncbi:MAG TPA: hypothetical protein VF186_02085 [Gaiellaceae bacterium]|jgi:hypothetical protein